MIPVTRRRARRHWRERKKQILIFPEWQRELFKTILDEEKLRFDHEGQPRTAYSLRHTYICLRLMEVPISTKSLKTAVPASR